MLEMAVMMGVGLWLLERLAFAILLLWAWGAIASVADEALAELSSLWNYTLRQRDAFYAVVN